MLSILDLAEVAAAFAALLSMLFVLVNRTHHISAQLFVVACMGTILSWAAFLAWVPHYPLSMWQHGLLAGLSSLTGAVWLLFLTAFAREMPTATPRSWTAPVWLIIALLLLSAGAAFLGRFFRGEQLESGEHIIAVTSLGNYYLVVMVVACAFGLLQLENTFRSSTGSIRRSLIMPVLSFGLMLAVTLSAAALGLLYGLVRFSAVQLAAVLLAITVVLVARFLVFEGARHQRVVLSRQTLYSSVGVLVVGGYLIAVGVIVKLLGTLGGSPKVFLSALAAFGVVVLFLVLLLSRSVKNRIRDFADRVLLGGRVDLPTELVSYADRVTAAVDKEEMFAVTSTVLSEKCNLTDISILLRLEDSSDFVRSYPDPDNKVLRLSRTEEWLLRSGSLTPVDSLLSGLSVQEDAERQALREFAGGFTMPLVARQELVGFVFCRSEGRLSGDAVILAETISHQLALSLLSARQSEDLVEAKALASFHKLSSFVVHDVKNVISMVSMILQNAERKFDDPRFQKSTIDTLAGAQARMKRMINRLSAPKQQADFPITDCDLQSIILDLVAEMKLQEQSKVTLALEVDRIPPVSGNREKIKGIISNLVINALEAIPGTGELHIWTDESSESVLLHVKDTGVGMREKFLREELFHPFKTTKADGLGIGLFQSRELARQMAGDLTAESQVGKGSVFTLELKKI
jgi:hypothetical protein